MRRGWYAVPVAAVALGLGACGSASAGDGGGGSEGSGGSAATAPTKGGAAATNKPAAKGSGKAAAKPTTSTLGPMPPVLSSSRPGVDSGAVTSLADLPAAFGCPTAVRPIDIPATPTSPAAIVCTSKLAGDEALFLWYVAGPDERYLALQTALAKAKHVRGGPTWVAGGMVSPEMGDVGGDVYK
jgi:hypothetical protein